MTTTTLDWNTIRIGDAIAEERLLRRVFRRFCGDIAGHAPRIDLVPAAA